MLKFLRFKIILIILLGIILSSKITIESYAFWFFLVSLRLVYFNLYESKKLSLLCFIDSLNSGGAQKQMVHLSNGFSKFYDVTLLKYHGLEFFSEKVDKNVKLVTIEHKNQFVRFFKIISFLYKMKPRFIISFLRGPNNYSLIYKLLFFWRKNILIVGERNLNVGNFKFKDFMSRALYFKANHIVCNSNAQK